ncbi:hypothetical protein [Nocardiopsis dassonvillei]|uniref:hypothetical protein n=1 Tax=Nocardiopsis dassonvillei TaxID=2014 RepID=UPI0033E65B1E
MARTPSSCGGSWWYAQPRGRTSGTPQGGFRIRRCAGPTTEPALGVSNFAPEHLERLIDQTGVVPALNQSELHPYFTQPDVQRADAAHGVLTQA